MKTIKKSKLPKTDSIQKLAEFWDTHNLSDFEAELKEIAEPVFVRRGTPESAIKPHQNTIGFRTRNEHPTNSRS